MAGASAVGWCWSLEGYGLLHARAILAGSLGRHVGHAHTTGCRKVLKPHSQLWHDDSLLHPIRTGPPTQAGTKRVCSRAARCHGWGWVIGCPRKMPAQFGEANMQGTWIEREKQECDGHALTSSDVECFGDLGNNGNTAMHVTALMPPRWQ